MDRGAYEDARERYQSLADGARTENRRAAFRLGEGLAAYRGGDFRAARSGFSGALLSSDPEVRRNAHLGMGNSLFQMGWDGLAESAYPADPAEVPDLDAFDAIARERIARMLDNPAPEVGETEGFARIRDTIINWSDAVRHYQSALALDQGDESALANSRTTMVFLERLRDLLEEERDETEQSMPDPQSGEGEPEPQPQPGEGEPGEGDPDEEPGEGEPQEDPNGEGEPDESEADGRDGEPDPDADPSDGDGEGDPQEPQPEPAESENTEDGDPNETPEERARRILSENADVETGPLNPGRREFLPPEKDW